MQAQSINNVPKPEKVTSEKAPKFKFTKDVHDFGKIPEGPSATYAFEFRNVGNAPLLIQNASASCGCTSPVWPKEPILPGKKGKVTVTYNTTGRGNQPFDKQVYITSNVPTENNKPVELHIKGFVNPASSTPQDVKVRK
jgi:hypothetical protein